MSLRCRKDAGRKRYCGCSAPILDLASIQWRPHRVCTHGQRFRKATLCSATHRTLASIQTSSSRQLRKTRPPMTLGPAGGTSRFSLATLLAQAKPMRCFRPPTPPSGEVSTSSRDTSSRTNVRQLPILHKGLRTCPSAHPCRRARPYECAGVSPRQTLSRRRGTSTCGHRRLYDRERSAYREPKRHGCIHHRRCRERTNPRPYLR